MVYDYLIVKSFTKSTIKKLKLYSLIHIVCYIDFKWSQTELHLWYHLVTFDTQINIINKIHISKHRKGSGSRDVMELFNQASYMLESIMYVKVIFGI